MTITLRAVPSELDLGTPWRGTRVSKQLSIVNDSPASAPVSLSVTGESFGIALETLELVPGDNPISVSASAETAGARTGQLVVTTDDDRHVQVPLSVVFRDPPPCGEASECSTFEFDRSTSQCVVVARPDGLECGAADKCLVDGRCLHGECVGKPLECDDQDPCTVDVCETVRGCATVPRICPGAPCLKGVCTKSAGCQQLPVEDGTRCGDVTSTSCTSIDICIEGQCVSRDPPDGFLCAEATPCRGEGRCLENVCEVPPARVLTPSWMLGQELTSDGGAFVNTWTDVFYDDDGGVVLSSYFASAPMLQAPGGPQLPRNSRRCISWNDQIVCADGPGGAVTGYRSATGAELWMYQNVFTDLPALKLPDWETFLARLVGLGPTRVGALYESRRAEEGQDTNCRRFSLVVLDPTGRRVVARVIDDAIFATCNHPHSYGVAADPQGNVFFAFTPSARVSPALPDPNAPGTVIMSYSPAGVLRWRHFIPGMPGGEISVGRGLIAVEAGRSVYDSARGVELDRLTIPFGDGLITNEWVVAGPRGSTAELLVPGSQQGLTTWSTPPFVASRSGLRGATWGTQPIALRFYQGNAITTLEAVSLSPFGRGALASLWSCAVADGGAPISFEVRRGGLAAMTDPMAGGAGLCEGCDPPYAGARGLFFEVDVPGLEPARMPWPGQWGGPGHDHQED